MQIPRISYTAHSSHLSPSKFSFLSPEFSDATMLSLSLYCGPESASRQKANTPIGLTSLVSLLRGVRNCTACCLVSEESRYTDSAWLFLLFQQENKSSPVIPSHMELEASDAMKWPRAVPPSHPTPKPVSGGIQHQRSDLGLMVSSEPRAQELG